ARGRGSSRRGWCASTTAPRGGARGGGPAGPPRGAALLLDISQCAGVMQLSLPALGADFAVCSGYKWLLGPYGTGFFWVSPDAQYQLQDGALYWMALEGARNFSALPMDDLKAAPGARRWDSPETASFLNLATWNAALDL